MVISIAHSIRAEVDREKERERERSKISLPKLFAFPAPSDPTGDDQCLVPA